MRLRAKPVLRVAPFVAVAAILGAVGAQPTYKEVTRTVAVSPEQLTAGPARGTTRRIVTGPGRTVSGPGAVNPRGLECAAGRNGGATDLGVTGTTIKLASTMVRSGIGKSFLGDSPIGMKALVQQVNRAGGICGRILQLRLVDDGWEAPRGQRFLQNFIKEGYFALPVVPSSEGLTQAIRAGDIRGIPIIGTDGMLREQYTNPWVWPVATATVSTMRIMAKHGYDKGSRTFAIVYDRYYKFGKEGADAFKGYVNSLPGAKVVQGGFVGIQPGQASYSAEIQQFNKACKGGCDFVAMLLEPATAEAWITGRPAFGVKATSGAQTLFNERFAKNCAAACEGMLVWTGYNPPIGTLASLSGIRQYVNDVRSVSPTADETNQFLEGAYLGMSVFVEAVRQVGPNLTRAALRQVMNQLLFQSDLASALSWSRTASGGNVANARAQAFSLVVAQGSFAGFRNEQTGFIADPRPGLIGK